MRSTGLSKVAERGLDLGLYASVIIVPLLYSGLFYDNIQAKAGVLLVLGGSLVVLLAVRAIAQRTVAVRRLPVYLPFLCFVLWGLVSAWHSLNPLLGLESLLEYAVPFVVFIVVVHRCGRARALARLLWALVLTNIATSAIGVLQYARLDLLGMSSASLPVSTLGNPNFVAYYQELVLPVIFAILVSQWRRLTHLQRRVLSVAFVLAGVHLILAGSRAGWLSAGVALLLVVALTARRRAWLAHAPAVVLAFLLLLPIGQLLLQSIPLDRTETLYDPASRAAEHTWERALSAFDTRDFSRSMRVLIWSGTMEMIRTEPLLGYGPGQYWSAVRPFIDQDAWSGLMQARTEAPHEPRHAHNEYLEFSAEMGLVGLGLMIWLFGTLLWMGRTYVRKGLAVNRKGRPGPVLAVTAGALGALVAALIHAGFAFNLHNPVASLYFWVFAGMMVAVNERRAVSAARVFSLDLTGTVRLAVPAVVAGAVAYLLCSTGLRVLMGDYYFARGSRFVAAERAPDAQAAFRQATAWRGYEFRYHRAAGRLYLVRGMYRQAQVELEHSLILHPNDAGALRLLGGILIRGGGDAIQMLQRAVQLDPMNTRGYALLAQAYRTVGDADSALGLLRKALAARPHEPRLVMALGLAQHDVGNLDGCIRTLERALRMAPKDGRIAGNLGAIYLEIGRPADAEKLLRQAVRGDAGNAMEWQANLSRALALQGKTREARAAAVDALVRTRDAEGLLELHRALLQKRQEDAP